MTIVFFSSSLGSLPGLVLVQILLLQMSRIPGSASFCATIIVRHGSTTASRVSSHRTTTTTTHSRPRAAATLFAGPTNIVDENNIDRNDDDVDIDMVDHVDESPAISILTDKIITTSDLKSLLPKQKMRFMKLDKFGRRIQRMEDDGTVNMRKIPRSNLEGGDYGEQDAVAPIHPSDFTDGGGAVQSPSLASFLGAKTGRSSTYYNDAEPTRNPEGGGIVSVDLKELLPKQKMKFLKLDKFGRRVQRMEDDGTVNMMKMPSSALTTPVTDEFIATDHSRSDSSNYDQMISTQVASDEQVASDVSNYGSLKHLLPVKRLTWTKLDFKGASIEDDRRMRARDPASENEAGGGDIIMDRNHGRVRGLKELLPMRPMWTKLDFRGASIEDERRTRKSTHRNDAKGYSSDGQHYSSLKQLLPERAITFRKYQVYSIGSATVVNSNNIVSNAMTKDDGFSSNDEDYSKADNKSFTNLTNLLPEKRISWRRTK